MWDQKEISCKQVVNKVLKGQDSDKIMDKVVVLRP